MSVWLQAGEEGPRVGNAYEFCWDSKFSYIRYRHIQGAEQGPSRIYRSYVNKESLSFTIGDGAEIGWDIELACTSRRPYGFSSSALYGKWILLNDIAGDPVGLAAGTSLRVVEGKSVRDVNSPYASYLNIEAFLSAGKEFIQGKHRKTEGYATVFLGLANRGAAWNRYRIGYGGKVLGNHILEGFSEGYFGYGTKKHPNVDHFRGWGSYAHRSIDLGVTYSYQFLIWGKLTVSYAGRIFARSYPEYAQTATLSYALPFSPI